MNFELFASSDAARPAYRGRYSVQGSVAEVEIAELGFNTGLTLGAGQVAAVASAIASHVAQVEGSLVSFGLVDGVQQ